MKKLLAIMLVLIMALAMVPALAEGTTEVTTPEGISEPEGTTEPEEISTPEGTTEPETTPEPEQPAPAMLKSPAKAPSTEKQIHWAITPENKLILSDTEYTEKLHSPVSKYYGTKGTIPADYNDTPYYGPNNTDIITSVEIRGSIAPTTMRNWFNGCKNLETADLSSIDASKLTNIRQLFGNCKSLKSVIFPANMSAAPLEQMSAVFYGCENLTALDLSGWNTSKVKEMRNVFGGCKALTSLNVSGWDVSNVKAMDYIFSGCSSLTSLDLSTWNVTLGAQGNGRSYGATGMFKGCSRLAELKLGEFRIIAGEEGPQNENTTMSTFEGCSALTSLHITEIAPTIPSDVWKPNLKNMFKGCSSLKTLTVDNWNISNITKKNQEGMFDDCNACIVLLNVTGTPHANEIPNVTLIPNGGTMADGSLPYVTDGEALPTLVKSRHIFGGWYTNEKFTGDKAEKAEAGKTYYAKWDDTQVEFLPGDGSGVMPGENLVGENNTLTFPECTFTAPANKEFAGWKITNPDDDNALYQPRQSKNFIPAQPGEELVPLPDVITVTAQWKDKQPEQQPSGGGNGGGYWHPTTTPVPVIVIPPKTGDMTVWQSILHFLGIR